MIKVNALEKKVKNLARHFGIYFSKQPAKYDLLKEEIRYNLLSQSNAVLHIGAHYGQEAKLYSSLNLQVIWIEAASQPFEILKKNIEKFENQIALRALLGDENKKSVKFYNASNNASSSIYNFGKDMPIPGLTMTGFDYLEMIKLDTLLNRKTLQKFDYWCLDVQGAELVVLKGAKKSLSFAKVIEIEVSTREEYVGGAKFEGIHKYLSKYDFFPLWFPNAHGHENLLYIRI